ncbi:hypothetical protein BC940DRAFT_333022 [Gongronella butleri]|nr:hypothetical protein BC940DRAFT_333022 [Gongronella butleri]
MGLLRKLPSFSRPKTRPKEPEDRPPMPMPASSASPALQIDLGFDKVETTTTHTAVAGTHAAVEPPKPASSASGPSTSLFDDIFSELKQQEHHDDSLLADYSLALAYTDQLQVSGTTASVSNGTSVANGSSMASQGVAAPTRTLTTSTSLFGPDSIYSNYASTGAQQGESMFASLLKPLPGGGGGSLSVSTGMTTQSMPKSMSSPSMTTAATAAGPTRDIRTQLVLDSDVSDENDDEDDDDDDDDDATAGALIDARGSASLGPCPIMARRPHDHRLNVSRKVDNWAKQIETDPAAANQMMFNRMKDRHRQQYKLAAMRQQPPMPNNMPTMPNYANGANFVPAPPSMMQAHPDGLLPTSFSANAIAHMVVPSSMCAVAQPPPHLNGVVPPVLHPAPPTRVPQPPVIDLRATSSTSPSASLPRSQSSTPCCTSPSNSSVSHVPSAKTVVDSEESDENDEIRENGEKSKNSDTDDKTTNQDNGHQDKADEKEALMPSQPMVRRPRSSSTASQKKKKDASLRRIKHAPLVAKQDEKDGTLARDASEQSDSDDADDEADDDASPHSSTSSSEALVPTPPQAPTLRPSASTGTAKRWSSTASRNKGPKKMQSVPDLKKKKRKSTPSSASVSTAASGSTPMTPSTSSHTAAAAASGKQHDEPPMPPMPLIKSMRSEPDLKTLQQQHQNYYAFQQQQLLWKQQQLQTQQRQLQLEWERMQLHQRDQQLKQQFLQLQQHQQQLSASIVRKGTSPP